ncbi:mannose-1-phosphate guanylyltransferase/mannose-6-phosphate isomerase [Halothiobacillus neapolitanus]|uniref:mannose-1-phosphate guanylyltransferase n=1 Tax=Halothiobacillus neapolitanus (strain ATCC 23641 / DSM 15147 / CIP 104769 / NCIMB 8539 / c2) TaxID=555778 RepID=D0KY20_HALNC|nr:mannose-1-phosphate guanylyltransferase/mannose-6-phosphate isomerase [Halothiobacillus neapolitanus]ACX95343.1 mannose-1-phosphate guanylyltransferase/mannose-6-phosphate isomerase [Halothiobacillus neapolitanus c2]TDN58329.1 mannose-1-phosphate guanylyltransferase (GDP) /mannose-6-phosphate isomerase type 2 [Halothiobacillus neapolitanus]
MIYPFILSGGAGTRLWPASRKAFPKPFMPLVDGQTLFDKTIERIKQLPSAGPLTVITNESLRFLTADALRGSVAKQPRLLLEPTGKNTAAAIALAALDLQIRAGSDALMLILPADHLIAEVGAFSEAVQVAENVANQDWLVTFGITPQSPETGFGYIERDAQPLALEEGVAYRVRKFVEKPDRETAQAYIDSGRYSWNGGMFCFKVSTILAEFERHAPELLAACQVAVEHANQIHVAGMDMVEFKADDFERMADISIDYAIMERSERVAVVAADMGWSDIGSWTAFADASPSNAEGNVFDGEVIAINTNNCLVRSPHRLVATVGVENLIVVDTPDALLIAHKDHAQDVRDVVAELKARGHESHLLHQTVHRPWGTYTVLEEGERFKMKRIEVKPGATLSLQMHHHRSEHWIVVNGMARVTNGDKVFLLNTNESTFIPAGHMHRLENPGVINLVMIEVQSGDYLGEDDIVRAQDNYGRS